jgi:cell division protein FtsN
MEEKMDFKPRMTRLFTGLIIFTLLLLFVPFTDSAFSATEDESIYVLHVSSFKNQKAAETEASELLKKGLQAFYKKEAIEGKGDWYRVFIGIFESRQEAKVKGAELVEKGIITYAAPRKVAQDFIPGKKAAEVEKAVAEPVKAPVIKEEAPTVVASPKPAGEPVEKKVQASPAPKKETAVDSGEKVETDQEKSVKETPAPEKNTEVKKEKKVETRPKTRSSPDESNFSLTLSGGAFISSGAGDFLITEETESTIWLYSFTGDAYQLSLESDIRAYKDLNIYGRVEYVFVDDVNILFASVGPKLRFEISDLVRPYIKGGLVWGDFSFDAVPGEFDSGIGYEGGFGMDILKSPFKIGLDFLYRSIEFDYTYAGIEGVTATESSINTSGISLSVAISYFF